MGFGAEFDSPRFGESVDGLRPGQDARSASHLYLAGALRGESAYLLREPAPASAACRRPRPLATNASRLLNARALHRVRFSAVWACVEAGHGQPELNRHRIDIGLGLCAENPRVRFANPHRLRPPAGVLARSLQTLRVCLTLAPCIEFDSPRYGHEIKRQVDIRIYLPVAIGGGAENRTPVHESPLIGISKLSRWFCLGRFARSDTLAAS